jgi:hypothetical protein
VRPERFELPTYCSGGNRSIQSELRAPTKSLLAVYMGRAGALNVPHLAVVVQFGLRVMPVKREILRYA